MDVLSWLCWIASSVIDSFWTLLWFLLSGWVSTLLQIALLVVAIYFVEYGWQRAPGEIWRRSPAFGGLF